MSAHDSADDLLADWLLERDGPAPPLPIDAGYRDGDEPMPIRERMARRQGFERVPSVWEVDDCECGWSSGHRDTCVCGSIAADVLGELDPGTVSR